MSRTSKRKLDRVIPEEQLQDNHGSPQPLKQTRSSTSSTSTKNTKTNMDPLPGFTRRRTSFRPSDRRQLSTSTSNTSTSSSTSSSSSSSSLSTKTPKMRHQKTVSRTSMKTPLRTNTKQSGARKAGSLFRTPLSTPKTSARTAQTPRSSAKKNKIVTIAEEYIPSAQLEPMENPSREAMLAQKYMLNEDWMKQFKAINSIRRLAVHHADEIKHNVSDICDKLEQTVSSLRSSIIKISLMCYIDVIDNLGGAVNAERVVPTLLIKSVNDKKFIKNEAMKAMEMLATKWASARTLSAFLLNAKDKNSKIVAAVAQLINSCLANLGTEGWKEIALEEELVHETVVNGCGFVVGKEGSTRTMGKTIVGHLNTNWESIVKCTSNEIECGFMEYAALDVEPSAMIKVRKSLGVNGKTSSSSSSSLGSSSSSSGSSLRSRKAAGRKGKRSNSSLTSSLSKKKIMIKEDKIPSGSNGTSSSKSGQPLKELKAEPEKLSLRETIRMQRAKNRKNKKQGSLFGGLSSGAVRVLPKNGAKKEKTMDVGKKLVALDSENQGENAMVMMNIDTGLVLKKEDISLESTGSVEKKLNDMVIESVEGDNNEQQQETQQEIQQDSMSVMIV